MINFLVGLVTLAVAIFILCVVAHFICKLIDKIQYKIIWIDICQIGSVIYYGAMAIVMITIIIMGCIELGKIVLGKI